MARQVPQLVLDDDPLVALTLRMPASLVRVVGAYCQFRGHDERKIPSAAVAAIEAWLAANDEFQTWRRSHPDVPDTAPTPVPKPSRARGGRRAPAGSTEA